MGTKSIDWRPGPTVCRCCLAEGCYKDISTEYFWMGKREVYSEMLTETFDINIAYSTSGPNSNSRLICEPCISRLRDACEFKRQVHECEKTFMQYLDPGASSTMLDTQVTVEVMDSEVKLEQVKQEKAHSDDDDDDDFAGPNYPDDDEDDDDLDDQPLTKFATRIPKKESVDILDLLDNAKAAEKRKSTTKSKAPPPKKTKVNLKDIQIKPTASKAKSSSTQGKVLKITPAKPPIQVKPVAKVVKKKKGSVDKIIWKSRRKYNNHRDNAALIVEYSNVCPFRWRRGTFTCAFCPVSYGDIAELKSHLVKHPNRQDVTRLSRHFDFIKAEISDLRCTLCQKPMKDLNALKDHLIAEHKIPIIKEHDIGITPFAISDKNCVCTICDANFQFFTKLNTHMNQHYQNNICFQCGKSFSGAQRLKAHLAIHETSKRSSFKCTKCEEVFPTRGLKDNHFTSVHGPIFRYRCPHCLESFMRYADRNKHLKSVHGRKIEYPCHLCKSVFAMCNQRTKHIQQVHIKNKQFCCTVCPYKCVTAGQLKNHMVKHGVERNFQCDVCKKAYARRKTLREHLRIHNNDKRFACELCDNAYVQKCSLQSHMRTHHPNAESLKSLRVMQ